MKFSFQDIQENEVIAAYVKHSDAYLNVLGYTDHSSQHTCKVSETAAELLENLGYSKADIELAKIAGYMHDIGNIVSRNGHSQSGAIMAFQMLTSLGMDAEDIAVIVSAIGNHDGEHGVAVHPVSAAVIIADKTDVRRTRVRSVDMSNLDEHDRVNYSVINSSLAIQKGTIKFIVTIDTNICSIMNFFELFLSRMTMCKNAATFLGVNFSIEANGTKLL